MSRITVHGRDNWRNPAEASRHDALTFGKTTLEPARVRTIVITRGDLLAGLAVFAAVCLGVAV